MWKRYTLQFEITTIKNIVHCLDIYLFNFQKKKRMYLIKQSIYYLLFIILYELKKWRINGSEELLSILFSSISFFGGSRMAAATLNGKIIIKLQSLWKKKDFQFLPWKFEESYKFTCSLKNDGTLTFIFHISVALWIFEKKEKLHLFEKRKEKRK